MTDLNFGAQPTINFSTLDAELRAALPTQLTGASYAKGVLYVHVKDGLDAEALRPQIAAVILAHNPATRSAEQLLQARREAAHTDLSAADFLAVLNQINAAASLADAKPIMRALLRLIYRVALAQGLTNAADPEA